MGQDIHKVPRSEVTLTQLKQLLKSLNSACADAAACNDSATIDGYWYPLHRIRSTVRERIQAEEKQALQALPQRDLRRREADAGARSRASDSCTSPGCRSGDTKVNAG